MKRYVFRMSYREDKHLKRTIDQIE